MRETVSGINNDTNQRYIGRMSKSLNIIYNTMKRVYIANNNKKPNNK